MNRRSAHDPNRAHFSRNPRLNNHVTCVLHSVDAAQNVEYERKPKRGDSSKGWVCPAKAKSKLGVPAGQIGSGNLPRVTLNPRVRVQRSVEIVPADQYPLLPR